jgi:hypothetical protein
MVESKLVELVVAGSNPVGHPNLHWGKRVIGSNVFLSFRWVNVLSVMVARNFKKFSPSEIIDANKNGKDANQKYKAADFEHPTIPGKNSSQRQYSANQN